jgi:Flp pilus assembly protein TadG
MPSTSLGEINKALRRFRHNQRGSAAIEFSMVALPFFAMLFAIFEFALMFFAGQVLETATQDSARLIFTNQAQDLKYSPDDFKNRLCANIHVSLFNCDNISVDVKVFSKFEAIPPQALADPIDAGHFQTTNFSYSSPDPGSTVIVRAFYEWPIFVNIAGYSLSNIVGGNSNSSRSKLLTAMAAFRVEPGATAK